MVVSNDIQPVSLKGLTLVIRRAIEHAENLEYVTVAIVTSEFVAGAVKAEYQFPTRAMAWSSPIRSAARLVTMSLFKATFPRLGRTK